MLDVFIEGSSEDSDYGDSDSCTDGTASSSSEGASDRIPIFPMTAWKLTSMTAHQKVRTQEQKIDH